MDKVQNYASDAANHIDMALALIHEDVAGAKKALSMSRVLLLGAGEKIGPEIVAPVFEAGRYLAREESNDVAPGFLEAHGGPLRELSGRLRRFASRRPEKKALPLKQAAKFYCDRRNDTVKHSSARTIINRELKGEEHRNERGEYFMTSLRALARRDHEKWIDRKCVDRY